MGGRRGSSAARTGGPNSDGRGRTASAPATHGAQGNGRPAPQGRGQGVGGVARAESLQPGALRARQRAHACPSAPLQVLHPSPFFLSLLPALSSVHRCHRISSSSLIFVFLIFVAWRHSQHPGTSHIMIIWALSSMVP